MVYIVPKMPKSQNITSTEYQGEQVYMQLIPNGLILHYIATNEVRLVVWDEIIAWAATAPAKPLPEEPAEPEKEPQKKGVREVRPAKPT